jgi:hypothetical protein
MTRTILGSLLTFPFTVSMRLSINTRPATPFKSHDAVSYTSHHAVLPPVAAGSISALGLFTSSSTGSQP